MGCGGDGAFPMVVSLRCLQLRFREFLGEACLHCLHLVV
jgi:hypothetical protein